MNQSRIFQLNIDSVPFSGHLIFYHRIDSHFLIKITDFGLSEDMFLRNYYREVAAGEMTKLPVKWMSPESLSDGHFSEMSDVVCVVDNILW